MNSVRTRWACRLGRHSPVTTRPQTCQYERRCTNCDALLESGVMHDWDEGGDKDATCAITQRCRQCGLKRAGYRHRTVRRTAADLGDTTIEPCEVVEVCFDCDDRRRTWHAEHVPDSFSCRRCGHSDDLEA
ncbi:hypothetical protein JIG36_00405 [Actinoplanes sp. LDG1-06]|uniref:Uncharacterized protein n=1 Tax=Paractinoplanes ovalisporus TaxID=2810368 RepID=A0ABS2A2W2_9ACTN|nr:hypothetical protein [Actinoplanes ovalisporus]MBM2614015.1 hypothetical protein [Actinoplanes ovalisporus]